jgi:uncharacterized protein (DUF433 family)
MAIRMGTWSTSWSSGHQGPPKQHVGQRHVTGGRRLNGVEYERITINPAQMRGVPCIRGLRIPIATVIGQLAAGRSAAEVVAEFPDLECEDIIAALEYAAAAVQELELPLTRPA